MQSETVKRKQNQAVKSQKSNKKEGRYYDNIIN